MNRDDCPTRPEALEEIWKLVGEIRARVKLSTIGTWDKINWSVALALALGGLAAAPLSGGLSLALTIAGILWLLLDMAKKLRESARDAKEAEEFGSMIKRIEFLKWCLE